MKVLKRGTRGYEPVSFDKITKRISILCEGLSDTVDPSEIALATIKSLYDSITTEELDRISAGVAESYKLVHPDYSTLAARIIISNLHKTTPSTFSESMRVIATQCDTKSERHYKFIMENAAALDAMIIHQNDYLLEYFGYKTLERSYLNKIQIPVLRNGKTVYIDPWDVEVNEANISFTKRGKPTTRRPDGRVVIIKPKMTEKIVDRPQYMFMRVAIAIHIASSVYLPLSSADGLPLSSADGLPLSSAGGLWLSSDHLKNIHKCYTLLSNMYFTHATPSLYNACTKIQQMMSCFLLDVDDNIESIMKVITDASLISKRAGGIGICQSKVRCHGALIRGTNGQSSGVLKQLKIWNETARCWDQGGRRLGAFAMYLEMWHGDIAKFLEMKLTSGAETERARDLFYALWVPDLFVIRMENDEDWSLFSSDTAPGLCEVYDGMEVCKRCNYCANRAYAKYILCKEASDDSSIELNGTPMPLDAAQWRCEHEGGHDYHYVDAFTQLYTEYENEGMAVMTVKARDIMNAICVSQRESGTPYISFKDHANRMTNQKNIGTIKSSNLCNEIYEWSSCASYACCVLASINLKKFIMRRSGQYDVDHVKLHEIVMFIAWNLDIIIDENDYPVPECARNSFDYRPIAMGVQGLADTFAIMRIPFVSPEAERIDVAIAETIYHAALTASCARARQCGAYKTFAGSPASRGILQPDLWMENQRRLDKYFTAQGKSGAFAGVDPRSDRYDWGALSQDVVKYGLRNSLHVAYMPTVSTSQIFGNNESFEPFEANIYTKSTLAGKFTITNTAMIRHLIELNLWDANMKNRIVNNNGSVQAITEIPQSVREIYKTVWEISQKDLMRRAALRSSFIDQSQSLNIYAPNNSNAVLRASFLEGWRVGNKTGSYYIRTRPAAQALKNNIATVASNALAIIGPAMAPPSLLNSSIVGASCRRDDPNCTNCSS